VTYKFPDGTKHARTFVVPVGPIVRRQLRHIPSDKLIHSICQGAGRDGSIAKLRGQAERKGYTVEPGYAIEDATKKIRGMIRS
jgi:hypothetical protein